MRLFKMFTMFSFSLISFYLCSFAQNAREITVTTDYLSGVWIIHHIDPTPERKQELKIKFLDKEHFEQWKEIGEKKSVTNKGLFKIENNFLVFIDQKGKENIYRIVQVSLMSLRLREKTAGDIITFERE